MKPIHETRWVLVVWAALLIGWGGPVGGIGARALAQDGAAAAGGVVAGSGSGEVTVATVQAAIAGLGEGQAGVREVYERAQADLQRAQASRERAAQLRQEASEAPGRLEGIRATLSQPAAGGDISVPADATLTQLEAEQAQAAAALAAARDQVTELASEATRRQTRRGEIPGRLANLRQRLDGLSAAGAAEGPANGPLNGPANGGAADGALAEARRVAREAERAALRSEIDELEAEVQNYDARRELLPARRDLATRRVTTLEQAVEKWRGVVSDRRQMEAQRAARDAERQRREAARAHPVLQAFAEETARLAEGRTGSEGIPALIGVASEREADARSRLASIRREYQNASERIETSGLNRATGLLLRRQFDELPDIPRLKKRVAETHRNLEEAQYTLIERLEKSEGAGDIDARVSDLLEEIEASGEGGAAALDEEQLRTVARELAEARRDLLAQLVSDSRRYRDELIYLDAVLSEYLAAAQAFESYIKERILWVRSIAGNRMPSVGDFVDAAGFYLDAAAWQRTGERVSVDLRRRLPLPAFMALLVVGLFVGAGFAKRRMRALGELAERFKTDSFRLTLETLGLTVLAALPWPVLLTWVGWVMSRPTDQTVLASSLGRGLIIAGLSLVPLSLLNQLCRGRGLADAHFRWPKPALTALRVNLRWFIPLVIPALALAVAIDTLGDESASASLGRAVFTIEMLAFAAFNFRILRPSGPVLKDLISRAEGGWVDRLRVIWFPLVVLAPVALAAIGWLGFLYTAWQLQVRAEQTIAFGLGLVILNGVLLRWLFVVRRRVAVEDARRRREQAQASVEASAAKGPQESTVAAIDEEKVDLPGISLQTKELFRTTILVSAVIGVYLIWADVLPALRMLDRVQLLPTPRVVELEGAQVDPVLAGGGSALETASTGPGGAPSEDAPADDADADAGTASDGSGAGVSPATSGRVAPTPVPVASGGGGGGGGDEGESAVDALVPPISVTVADLIAAVVVLIGTLVAFRNLPALVEIVILQRLPLDAGSRYALSTVLRYLIAIIGVAIASAALDLSWSKLQWLAAALTFGLAFGLQEIFANFVSGLIILGERPIRIGDTVTVGGVSGTVTKIKMRATTITDWDRKELVIPNKTFITGDVINWTLSDPMLRVSIVVGVGYGEDVDLAEKTLVRVAKATPNVLEDPEPYVYFNQFGDSTLNFELRVFIPDIQYLIATKHALHMAIVKAFREEDIEIAFPQRDLHIRTGGGLEEAIRGSRKGRGAGGDGGVVDASEIEGT